LPDGREMNAQTETFVPALVALASKGNSESLQFFFSAYPDLRDYLPFHAVNVCLLSLELALEMRYDPSVLPELAQGALLHDLGMLNVLELARKAAKLESQEMASVKLHPQKGAEMLAKAARELPRAVADIVMNEHERLDGSGYPKGSKNEQIPETAQIVGLADVYEALVHARAWRGSQHPSDAINTILNAKSGFNPKVIKALIERVGIFPVGSKVRLNTKELAVVAKVNPFSPLRPVVCVIADAQGIELKTPKEINLSKNYLVFIEENIESPGVKG
jgi:HD-GYP domain-containing protein (c-di-GMP phosphodiesterase class II)